MSLLRNKQINFKIIGVAIFFILLSLILTVSVSATEIPANGPSVYENLINEDNSAVVEAGLYHPAWMLTDVIRSMVWSLVTITGQILDGLYDILMSIMQINIFDLKVDGEKFDYGIYDQIAWALFTITIIVSTFFMLTSKNIEVERLFKKIILIAFFIGFFVPLTSAIYTNVFKIAINEAQDETPFGQKAVLENTYDMEQSIIIEKPITVENNSNFNSDNIYKIDINEKINDNNVDGEKEWQTIKSKTHNPDLKYWLGQKQYPRLKVEDGQIKTVPLHKKGWLGLGQESLYKYEMNFWGVLLLNIILFIGIGFAIVKIAKIVLFEFPFALFTGSMIGAISNKKEKIIKIVTEVLTMLGGSLVTFYSIFFVMSIITATSSLSGINMMGDILIYLAGALFLIGGSQFFTKLIGYDPGVQDGLTAMRGTQMGTSVAGAAVGGTISGASGIGKRFYSGEKANQDTFKKAQEKQNHNNGETKRNDQNGFEIDTGIKAKNKNEEKENITNNNSLTNDIDTGINGKAIDETDVDSGINNNSIEDYNIDTGVSVSDSDEPSIDTEAHNPYESGREDRYGVDGVVDSNKEERGNTDLDNEYKGINNSGDNYINSDEKYNQNFNSKLNTVDQQNEDQRIEKNITHKKHKNNKNGKNEQNPFENNSK